MKNYNKEFKFGVLLIFLEIATFLILLLVNFKQNLETVCILYLMVVTFVDVAWMIILITRKYVDYDFESELLQNRDLPASLLKKMANKKTQFLVFFIVIGIEFVYLVSLIVTSICIPVSIVVMLMSFTFINFINICFLGFALLNKHKEEEMLLKLYLEKSTEEEK